MDYGHLETEYGQVNLLILKSLRKKVNLEIKEERREFICRIYPLINDWTGKYPDLGSIFRPEELDWLLSDSMDLKYLGPNKIKGGQFIEFVTRSGYKDKPNVDENGKPLLQRITALLHSAKLVISNNKELVRCLFTIYDRFDANYIDERGLTHFHIACRHDFDDIVKKFLEHGLDPNIPKTEEVSTPLNLTIDHKRKKCFELLLRNGANPNGADDEGLTPLHRLCEKDVNYDWMELFFQINDDIQRTVLVDARDNDSETPMHTALYHEEIKKFKFLLKRRAGPNIANEEGLTPLHIICNRKIDDDLAKIFLKLNDSIHQTVQIDVQDKLGNTPLHWALSCGNKKVAEILLRRGATINLADQNGWTPLHFFSTNFSYHNLMKILFEIRDKKHQPVHLDAKNKKGDTPLHLALSSANKKAVELLLRNGADPNLADADGSTSLHLICERNEDDDLVEIFFKTIDAKHRPVHIDARDKLDWTPLESAVANLLPHVVDVLLNHGADISNFSFPNNSDFDLILPNSLDYKFELASRVLTIVESLEIRGYELNRNEILTIMKFFTKHKLTDNSGLDEFWHSTEGVLSKAKKILMNPSMSLYELIRSKNKL